ncbi:MAG TPA: hypothetical protein VE870_10395 [Bacteroidales bacterium]|nr:hypothetical protein [Bacteroidales bacterium]
MSINSSITGLWKGEFTLGPEYGSREGKSFDFTAELNEDDDFSIEGVCEEGETKDLFKEPVTINGFRDDEFISFVKKYPCLVLVDEQGKYFTEKEKEHPDIEYEGELDPETGRLQGTFSTYNIMEDPNGRRFEVVFTGTWFLHRSES